MLASAASNRSVAPKADWVESKLPSEFGDPNGILRSEGIIVASAAPADCISVLSTDALRFVAYLARTFGEEVSRLRQRRVGIQRP